MSYHGVPANATHPKTCWQTSANYTLAPVGVSVTIYVFFNGRLGKVLGNFDQCRIFLAAEALHMDRKQAQNSMVGFPSCMRVAGNNSHSLIPDFKPSIDDQSVPHPEDVATRECFNSLMVFMALES